MSVHDVRAIVVAYGAADSVERCLDHLAGCVPVTIVDNSSSSDVRRAAEHHDADYIDTGRNRGFAAGVNVGLQRIRVASPSDVLLVNPDALVSPTVVDTLAETLRGTGAARIAAVAPKLVDTNGIAQRVQWPFPSPARAWLQAVGLGRLPAREHFVVGAVMLLRREAVEEVGDFDERFFLYAEEADWQRRALARNWRSAVCDDVIALHAGGGASDDPAIREALFHAGQETYIRKWYGAVGWRVYALGVIAGAVIRAVLPPRYRRVAAARRARLYLRGPRRSAGLETH